MADTHTGDTFCTDCGTNLHGHAYCLGSGMYCGRCYRVRIAEDPAPPQMPPTITPTVGALEGGPMPEELRKLGDEEFVKECRARGGGRDTFEMATRYSEALRRLEAAGNPDVNCPECGGADGEIRRYGDRGWFVTCCGCKHEGPCRPTIPEAIKAWKEKA